MIGSVKRKYKEVTRIYGRNAAPLYFGYYLLHKCIEAIYIKWIKMRYPVDDTLIILRSFPDYSDNAKALAEYLVKNGYTKKYKIYFDVKDLEDYKNRTEGITFFSSKLKMGCYRLSCLRLILTAKYLLSTHDLIIDKRHAQKGQCLVRLWHGCGYKTRKRPERPEMADAALVPGPLFVKVKAAFWNIDEKYIIPIGYPRYDWLRSKDDDTLKLVNSFRTNENTKVIIWMPTFRKDKYGRAKYDYIKITQFPILYSIDDWKRLDSFCARNNVVIVVKRHPFQEDYPIPFDSFSNIKEIKSDLFEQTNIQMYQFIGATDALVSDYSSIAIDYLIVDKPIAFTLDYYEEEKKTRKFIFDDIREYMPGHHLYNIKDMENFIIDVSKGNDPYKDKRRQMYDMSITPSDCYCKSVLEHFGITIC